MDEILAIRVYGCPDGLIEFADSREAPAMECAGWDRVRAAPPLKVALRPPRNARPDTLAVSGRFLFLRGRLAEVAARHLAEVAIVLAYRWTVADRWQWIHGLDVVPPAELPVDPNGVFAVWVEPPAAKATASPVLAVAA